MPSSQATIGTARRLILAVVFAFSVPAVFAQAPPAGSRDDLDVTMKTIGSPDAKDPDEIVRKIPPPKAKKRAKGTDDRADDLASPGENGDGDQGGSAVDPESPVVPIVPVVPDVPDAPAAPDDTGTPVHPNPGPGPNPGPSPGPGLGPGPGFG